MDRKLDITSLRRRAGHCTTHHAACDCVELRHAEEIERLQRTNEQLEDRLIAADKAQQCLLTERGDLRVRVEELEAENRAMRSVVEAAIKYKKSWEESDAAKAKIKAFGIGLHDSTMVYQSRCDLWDVLDAYEAQKGKE
jgi:hypothetical protein